MASLKLSALTAVTSTDDASLILVADTSDSGSTYASKKITKANLLNGQATESYVTTQISNLIDSSPSTLNTLNAIAAAIGDDANYATTVTTLVAANETHIDNVATLTGVTKDSTDLGSFSGTTISANTTLKSALQELETSLETKASGSIFSSHLSTSAAKFQDISDLITLSGVSQNTNNLGTFTGSTIGDNVSIKAALQSLESTVDNLNAGTGSATLVQTTTDATDATRYLTFVADDNVTATTEAIMTDAGVTYNPSNNTLTATAFSGTLYGNVTGNVTGDVTTTSLSLGGTTVTATAADLNNLNGLTSTAAELNILDGVTSTATELNILDGVTATTTELNYIDGVTSAVQTQIDAKCDTGVNVNTFVASTSAQTTPGTYYFLVSDQSDGSIKVINESLAPLASPTFTGTVAIPNIANLETAVSANTAKVTNVSTDLSVTADGTSLSVVSSDGTNASLPLADTNNWGVMSDEMFDKLDGIEASANNYSISADLLDEDDFASNSSTKAPSQQSVKAWIDANPGVTLLDEDDFASDSATAAASQQSIKAYVEAFDFTSLTALP